MPRRNPIGLIEAVIMARQRAVGENVRPAVSLLILTAPLMRRAAQPAVGSWACRALNAMDDAVTGFASSNRMAAFVTSITIPPTALCAIEQR